MWKPTNGSCAQTRASASAPEGYGTAINTGGTRVRGSEERTCARLDRSSQWAGRAIGSMRVPLCLELAARVPLIFCAAAGPLATVGVITHVGAAIRCRAPAP